jgi:hypothetical protein
MTGSKQVSLVAEKSQRSRKTERNVPLRETERRERSRMT